MVLAFDAKSVAASTVTVLNRSEAEFQNETRRCDNRDDFEKSSQPSYESRGVHKISTPWLVAEKDRSSAKKYSNNDNEKYGNKKNRIQGVSSIQGSHALTDDTSTKRQGKNPHQPALRLQKQQASIKDDIEPVLKPTVSPTRYNELLSYHPHHVFPGGTSNDITSIEMEQTSNEEIDDIDTNDKHFLESIESSANHKVHIRQCVKNHNKSIQFENVNNELYPLTYGNKMNSTTNICEDEPLAKMMVSPAIPDKHCITNNINGIRRNNTPITPPRTKEMDCTKEYFEYQHPEFCTKGNGENLMKSPDRKVAASRVRNRRSPSPSRLRGKLESKKSAELQKRTFEHQRHISTDYDRELLMGIEMHRDLDRMSLNCGARGSEARSPSYSRIERKPPRGNSMRFSILPSSMSCFNPTSQLDGFETTENSAHNTNIDDEHNRARVDKRAPSSTRLKSMTNNFCSEASSALFLDIEDDDTFWTHYDDRKPMYHQSSNLERTRTKITSRESRECHNSLTKQPGENYAIDREERVSCDGDRFDQFGHSTSNDVIKKRDSNDLPILKKTRNRTMHDEERGAFLKYRTSMPFESERHYAQNLAIGEDLTLHRRSVSASRQDSLINFNSRDMSSAEEYISMSENDKESKFRYESLMNYPTQFKHEEEEFQSNKEALLDQMRHAVQNASAQLDLRQKVQSMNSSSKEQYRTMTMETECSDEISYETNELFQSVVGKRITSEFTNDVYVISPGIKRDKSDFN